MNISRVVAVMCVVSLAGVPAVRAQHAPGSYPTTAALAAAGGAAGMIAVGLLAQPGSSACPAIPGAQCSSGSAPVLLLAGASIAGSTLGAMLGRSLGGGRQSVFRTAMGSALGLMVGGLIASQLRSEDPAPLVVSFSVPQGVFAALVGW